MTEYLWETHMHTSETSRCARSPAAKMVAAYKDAGYHGIVVTDHFLNGYSCMEKDWPWQKRIDGLLKGYLAAREAGEKLGLCVLLGWEYYDQGGDFLTFGLSEAFLRDHDDLCDIPLDEYVRRVRAAGGFVSQAHPYRRAAYLPEQVAVRVDIVDGLEVFNGSHKVEQRSFDDQALETALAHGLLQTAGSDAHSVRAAATAAMAFSEPFDTAEELVRALKARQGRAVRRTA